MAAPALAEEAGLPAGAPGVIIEGSGNVSVGGQPAARKGDRTDDGHAAVEGSKNVFINGRPAVTVGDISSCGGVVVGGAHNVFVNGKPLARAWRSDVRVPRQVNASSGVLAGFRRDWLPVLKCKPVFWGSAG